MLKPGRDVFARRIIDPLVLYQHIMTLFPLYQLIETLSIILSVGCWRNRMTVAFYNIIELLDRTLITSIGLCLLCVIANHGVPPIKCTVFIMRSLR